ncbi:MAG: bifunctional 5,10-methylenetetrahydrofolate dehydrogenase/5,10-methenyltetrahydrofolate cyclohydrolase [Candidatus Eremiobacteraeota bacterium]|nr:bifunctional 5,10-methylenetetrahydrofolate dehydrogenase/5,10-methenyltetrahydrofolate cyclohydrolase [Candidatus Eremiobacteraeota bacterium]
MSATIIDGRALASTLRSRVVERARVLRLKGVSPRLVVSFVGDDASSAAYVRSLVRAGEQASVDVRVDSLDEGIAETALRERLRLHAADPHVHGIVLAQPLPKRLAIERIGDAIPLEKDVDGTNPQTLGLLALGSGGFTPATPAAILRLLETSPAVPLAGKRALVIGRSRVVGLPVALLLLARNATVTIAHSKTADLARAVRDAEIVVAAAGVPSLVGAAMLAPGSVVIDAGTTVAGDKLVGDVDPDARSVAAALTPVPGGVGPVTNVVLMENVVAAAERLSSG